MLVLFKNVKMDGVLCDVAVPTSNIHSVTTYENVVRIAVFDSDGGWVAALVNLPIEQVVGLINQAMGAVTIPDAPEKSVVVITGKDAL